MIGKGDIYSTLTFHQDSKTSTTLKSFPKVILKLMRGKDVPISRISYAIFYYWCSCPWDIESRCRCSFLKQDELKLNWGIRWHHTGITTASILGIVIESGRNVLAEDLSDRCSTKDCPGVKLCFQIKNNFYCHILMYIIQILSMLFAITCLIYNKNTFVYIK